MLQTLPPLADAFRQHTPLLEAVPHPAWRNARAQLIEAVRARRPALLLGLPGTGKSLLLREIARICHPATGPVRHATRGDALDDPLAPGLLLVDEAGCMDPATWDAVLSRPGPFVLAGLPSLEDRLDGTARDVARITLHSMTPLEVALFVATRLSLAGQPRATFEPDAVLALARHSGGLARPMLRLAGAAAFASTFDGDPGVTRRHVDEAAANAGGGPAALRLSGPLLRLPGPALRLPSPVLCLPGPMPDAAPPLSPPPMLQPVLPVVPVHRPHHRMAPAFVLPTARAKLACAKPARRLMMTGALGLVAVLLAGTCLAWAATAELPAASIASAPETMSPVL